MKNERLTGQGGMTLVEVMAAGALLAIGAFALLTGLRSSGLTAGLADRQTHAAAIAQRYMETFRHRPDADPYHESQTVETDYQVEVSVTPYGEGDDLVLVRVEAWYRPAPETRADYTTVVRVEP